MVLLGTIVLRGAVINVAPGEGTIKAAVGQAAAGDELVLTDGEYTESSVKPTVGLTIQAAEGTKPKLILSSRFEVKEDFTLEGIKIESAGMIYAEGGAGSAGIGGGDNSSCGKITIAKKTGKVTIKKGLKKGTYTVKVKVKAAKTRNYNALTKTVTFKIKVK